MRDGRLPVLVITGFLGAGKTSLLNALLRAPEMAASLVLINEWGDVGIDHLLVDKIDGDMILLSSGCVCCTLRGDLIDALRLCLDQRQSGVRPLFERIVIETTGLADPVPVVQSIVGDAAVATRLRLAGVVTLIDAVNSAATIAGQRVAARQIALADVLAISKSDLIDPAARSAALRDLAGQLRVLNPAARIVDAAAEDFCVRDFLALEQSDMLSERQKPPTGPTHNSWIKTRVLRSATPVDELEFAAFLAWLKDAYGPKLLRVKGLVALAGNPDSPLVLQGAQHVFQAPQRLDHWPDGDRTTRIVIIAEGAPLAAIDRFWGALTHATTIDAPDMAALVQSPLGAPRAGQLF